MHIRARVATLGALLAVAAGAALGPSLALADNPSIGQLLVPGDHHLPGATIEVTGYELDPGMALQLTLVSPTRTAVLASTTVREDGTFSAHATVPSDFPTGYANVVATGSSGGSWTTVILVGERAEGPRPLDAQSFDGSPIGIAMLGVGLVIALAAGGWYLRDRRRSTRTRG
jgi:hypothetical protein